MSLSSEQNVVISKDDTTESEAILSLFNAIFSKRYSPSRWRWEHKENPNGDTFHEVARAESRIVGQSAAVPMLFNHAGRILKTARVQNVMVHPEFRKKGIFFRTLKGLSERLGDEQIDFIITFPNDKSIGAFVEKLDYEHVFDISTYALPVGETLVAHGGRLSYETEKDIRFKQEDMAFIKSQLRAFEIYNIRDFGYMHWRYNRRSDNRYMINRIYQEQKQVGLVVSKVYQENMSIDLMEFFSICDKEIIRYTLHAVRESQGDTALHSFNLWSAEHYPTHEVLVDLGLKKTEGKTHVVYKSLSPNVSKRCHKKDSYFLSMGDSDVY